MSSYRKIISVQSMTDINMIVVKPCISLYEREKIARSASERLLHTAAVLPENGYIGWNILCEKGKWINAIYSSANIVVTRDDYSWIFHECGEAVELSDDRINEKRDQSRNIYVLKYITTGDSEKQQQQRCHHNRTYDHEGEHTIAFDYFRELMRMLEAECAEVGIIMFGSKNEPAVGNIFISLSDEMTLRLRTMISLTFPYTEICHLKGMEIDEIGSVPENLIQSSINGILQVLMSESAERLEDTGEIAGNEIDDEFEKIEGIQEEKKDIQGNVKIVGFTPIEEMELGVRSYNCLKRAGIDSIEKLRLVSDEELRHLRNLGYKSFMEIKERLAEMSEDMSAIPLTKKCYRSMLDELIGLECVKEQVKKIAAFARMKNEMRDDVSVPVALNMEFVGNPGTAKTTVARILAGILNEIGLLSGNELIEVGRADLIARYEGQTAEKVKSVFNRAKGKVLFIDEAYSLLETWEGEFGDEAINTIVQEMENNRNDTVVIFAGYPDKMEAFFARNPGLRSRVPFVINFKDYTADELAQIAEIEAEKRGFSIDYESRNKVLDICRSAISDPNMGNGRFSRNLVEDAILSYALRVYGKENDDEVCGNFTLISEDFSFPNNLGEIKKGTQIGFRV